MTSCSTEKKIIRDNNLLCEGHSIQPVYNEKEKNCCSKFSTGYLLILDIVTSKLCKGLKTLSK